MKVLFLNPIATLGGAEHVLLDVIASLRRSSPELELELLALETGPLLAEAQALGARIDVFELPRTLKQLGESGQSDHGTGWLTYAKAGAALGSWVPGFAHHLRRKHADVMHSNGLKTHVLAALAKPGSVPLVWHLHDFVSERRVSTRLLPLMQRRANLGVAVSRAVCEDAQAILKQLRIESLLNGVRTELFVPGTVEPLDLDAVAGLDSAPAGTVRIGLIATYASWKGHHLFLEAARRIVSADVRFYIVGGPVYSTAGSQISESQLRAAISQLQLGDRCGLVPFQRHIARVYAGLDIVVQASTRREPFGRTVAEAMASGRTVIAPRLGGILEQIEDGENGLLFRANDTESLVSVLRRAIGSETLRSDIARRGLTTAQHALDYARLGPHLRTLYEGLHTPRQGAARRY